MKERRRSARLQVRIGTSIEMLPDFDDGDRTTSAASQRFLAIHSPEQVRFSGVILNISIVGAFVAAPRVPPLRSRVRLVLEPDVSDGRAAVGLVVWRRTEEGSPRGFGVLFQSFSPDMTEFIRNLPPY